ncbi:TROVE domain-containing protein [Ruixingdingia sedimenti]|uniref:TROVE domain-containing protein n=1 Tax=Ruixingdingia sedimenti TaxID=3073604 RepID=A0ABU1FC59_9RHOB|nr:TROVE domain-containing protein [Xinfangfangia sp. LG-4]MDR5654484.1 TROVE domain-containing protein [Xinfangfangia sp. LG-4]
MRMNTVQHFHPNHRTHGGAPAQVVSPEQQLRRLVMASLLWEDSFYVDGKTSTDLVAEAIKRVDPQRVGDIAIEAREQQHLRHMPLYLVAHLAAAQPGGTWLKHVIARVVKRADELAELVALYCQVTGQSPKAIGKLPAQLKKGLALAFPKFDAYQLAKYDRAGAITLTDVARLVHPAHTDAIGGLVKGTLSAPDTWEVALSGGADKKEAFTRLLQEGKLGYLALLRNLRNMTEANVDRLLVQDAILARKGAGNVLPFRFVAAARACPSLEPALDQALVNSIAEAAKLPGRTIILVDVSGSMDDKLSGKSDLTRMDAAAALASVLPCEDLRVFTFSDRVVEVPARRGMAGVDAVIRSQPHGCTYLAQAVQAVNQHADYDRLVVITDEQGSDGALPPAKGKFGGYLVNVAAYENGVAHGKTWTQVSGWSEGIIKFIAACER